MIFSHFLCTRPFIVVNHGRTNESVDMSNIISKVCVDPYAIDLANVSVRFWGCCCCCCLPNLFVFSIAYLPFALQFSLQKSNPFLPLNLSQFLFYAYIHFCCSPHFSITLSLSRSLADSLLLFLFFCMCACVNVACKIHNSICDLFVRKFH